MPTSFRWDFKYPSRRMPILATNVVSTSQPLACQAGLNILKKGGNAIDAAVATAIALTVVEPTMNGIGSDAFAIIWDGKKIVGLNASGRAPSGWTPEHFAHLTSMPLVGWDTVTIPGAVSAWVELSQKYGNLRFKELFEPAINYAENGFLVSPITAQVWSMATKMFKKAEFPEFHNNFLPNGNAPKAGELFRHPAQAHSLKLISETDGEAFYSGELAKKIINHSNNTGGVMTFNDLENHRATWEDLLDIEFNGVKLHEIPPNGQGLATLIMIGILKNYTDSNDDNPDSTESLHIQLEAMKLAFADAHRYISDKMTLEFNPSLLLKAEYLKDRAKLINPNRANAYTFGIPKKNDTVYLTTADSEGMMVSYIQSNYMGFGSGIVVPGTGISLQNRGNGFSLTEGHPNQVGPNKRPYHTIIPAFVTKKGKPLMSFGVMGGTMQSQGHAQLMIRIFKHNQNPQSAIDAPRWRIAEELTVRLENGFDKKIYGDLSALGHNILKAHYIDFGGAQLIYKLDDGYLAASDPRKDGQAVGY